MNVMHIEEMIQIERKLLSALPLEEYRLNLVTEEELRSFSHQQPQLFGPCSQSTRQDLEKLLSQVKNIRSIPLAKGNSALKLFACALLTLIFPSSNKNKGLNVNSLLLETFKCTLYSQDVNLTKLAHLDTPLDNFQAKAMIARFLDLVSSEKDNINMDMSRYLQVFLNKNPKILTALIAFYRFVLYKLGIEGAEDFSKEVPFDQIVVNLAEYFDIGYRNFTYMFLFYQDNIFIATANGEAVLGEYGENQEKEISFKDSSRFNMLQSALLRSSQRSGSGKQKRKMDPQHQKLFNFMFESTEFKNFHKDLEIERSVDFDTPHFGEANELIFGRKKRDEKDQDPKRAKATLNSSVESLKDFNINECMAILKSLDEKENLLNSERSLGVNMICQEGSSRQGIENQEIFDSPIKQIDQGLYQSNISNNGQGTSKEASLSLAMLKSSGKSTKSNQNRHQVTSSIVMENKLNTFLECQCRVSKLAKSTIISQTVSFNYMPIKPKYFFKAQPFKGNLTCSQKLSDNNSYKASPQKYKKTVTPLQKPEGREERTPAFLKCLKKNKEKAENTPSEKEIKTPIKGNEKDRGTGVKPDIQNVKSEVKIRRLSAIIKLPNQSRLREIPLRDTIKTNASYVPLAKKRGLQNMVLKKFDITGMINRPTLGSNSQSASSFTHNTQVGTARKSPNGVINNSERDQKKTVRVIPPVCFSNTEKKRLTFKTSSFTEQDKIAKLKDSQRIIKTQSSSEVLCGSK